MKLKRISRESNYGEFATFGSGLSPQISYKYDNATTSWKKHYNIYDHLGTLAQTYKQSGFGATPTSMQTHNPYGGERWTNKNLTTTESTLLNWIGKEKDHESKLGDHGVRKYEYETGRFISIDPLWGNYYGWTPYQYSMNSPVMLVDVDGEKPNKSYRNQDNLKDNTDYNRLGPKREICNSCIKNSTIGQNIGGMTYAGGNNPTDYEGDDSFQFTPTNRADFPPIGHDRRYINVGASGLKSLLFERRVIGADWLFVAEEMNIAFDNKNSIKEQFSAFTLGISLGMAATPKTMYQMVVHPTTWLEDTYSWFLMSNEGVNNSPEEHTHDESKKEE